MNYEKYLIAYTTIGETGSSLVVIKQTKESIDVVKLFPGGHLNITFKPKEFKKKIHDKELTVVEKLPSDVFSAFKSTWNTNLEVDKKI